MFKPSKLGKLRRN